MSKFLFNNEIPYKEVRLKDDGNSVGVFTLKEVLVMADEAGKDVVLITEKATPPVVELCNKTRFLYEIKKKEDQQRKKQHHMVLKEIKFGVDIGMNDIHHKINSIKKIINQGDKVKISIRLRLKQLSKKDNAIALLQQTSEELQTFCKLEKEITIEDNIIYAVFSPNLVAKIVK